LPDVVVPLEYPSALLADNVGVFRLDQTSSDGVVQFVPAGTPAQSACVYDGTGDTVGGWLYTGDPGDLSLALLFESDGTSVVDVGMRVTFEGPADVDFLEEVVNEVIPGDVDINDRCTPIERSPSTWAQGAALEE
jgi:hypothetical protein